MPACKTNMADVNKRLSGDISTQGSSETSLGMSQDSLTPQLQGAAQSGNTQPPQLQNSPVPEVESVPADRYPVKMNGASTLINEGVVDQLAMDGFESGFFKYMLNPMMSEMERTVNQSNEILDDLLKNLKAERESQRKREMSSHIPQLLQSRGVEMEDILNHVESFIVYENYDVEKGADQDKSKLIPAAVRDLDPVARLSILGHSVAAYVSLLDSQHLKHIANKIVTDVTVWICALFRFPNASAHMHEEEREGLVRTAHLALHRKYPKYATDGYEVLFPHPPVFYISSASKHNISQHLCHQLGLPLSCVCSLPTSVGRIDVAALQKLIEDDISTGKVPVMLVAFAGTPLLGRVDDLAKLSELCHQHDIWLHLEGSSLTQLPASTLPPYLSAATQANSATINIGAWLALPAVPFVTLFHSPDVMLTRAASLSTFNVRYRLNCVSLWMCMLTLGSDNTIARLLFHTRIASLLHSKLSNIQTANDLILLDVEGPCVILRYQRRSLNNSAAIETSSANSTSGANQQGNDVGNTVKEGLLGAGAEANDSRTRQQSDAAKSADRDQYFDTLNIWLVETLRREVPEIHVAAVELEKVGLCIRYAPLETSFMLTSCSLFDITPETIERFVLCLEHNIDILDATVSMKQSFEDIVEGQDNMRVVHLPSWAGLGAVQYIPEKWLKEVDNLPDHARKEINIINHQMVNQLKSTDTAFSLGQTESGLYCVRFGLVTEDTDLEELIAMVYTAGRDVEESSKFIETMSDVVRQGIEQAAIDLMKENQDKLVQEGVLRQVPLVSSFINWWSPPPKDPIKGRTFNLTSGKIASTEDTYKYHMQIQEGPAEPTSTATRAKDAPLKASLKPARSKRVEMHTSATYPAAATADAAAGSLDVAVAAEALENQQLSDADATNVRHPSAEVVSTEQSVTGNSTAAS